MRTDQERSATTPRTEAEAKGMGWTVDRHVWPWIAYLGPRFDPDRLVEIETPAHGGGLPATPPIRERSTTHDNPEDSEPQIDNEPLSSQVARLARFIMDEIPGEPSQNEGAIDCAIRLLRVAYSDREVHHG